MNKFYLFALAIFCCVSVKAQEIGLGLRDNQYVNANYVSNLSVTKIHKLIVGFEQSLLNVKMTEQSGRVFVGYGFDKDSWIANAIAYAGTEYAGNWQIAGVWMNGYYTWKRISFGATVNPNYDTSLGFQFNYDLEGSAALFSKVYEGFGKQQLDLCASFGNLPEFRDNIRNLRIGLKFTSGNLWVKPEVCVPGIGDKNLTSSKFRVLCSMGWLIAVKKK